MIAEAGVGADAAGQIVSEFKSRWYRSATILAPSILSRH